MCRNILTPIEFCNHANDTSSKAMLSNPKFLALIQEFAQSFHVSDLVTIVNGSNVTLESQLYTIDLDVYETNIFQIHEIGLTTRERRNCPFKLLVSLGGRKEAYEDMYVDNEESLEMVIEYRT